MLSFKVFFGKIAELSFNFETGVTFQELRSKLKWAMGDILRKTITRSAFVIVRSLQHSLCASIPQHLGCPLGRAKASVNLPRQVFYTKLKIMTQEGDKKMRHMQASRTISYHMQWVIWWWVSACTQKALYKLSAATKSLHLLGGISLHVLLNVFRDHISHGLILSRPVVPHTCLYVRVSQYRLHADGRQPLFQDRQQALRPQGLWGSQWRDEWLKGSKNPADKPWGASCKIWLYMVAFTSGRGLPGQKAGRRSHRSHCGMARCRQHHQARHYIMLQSTRSSTSRSFRSRC